MNVQEGGTFHSCVHDPKHGNCWIKGVYQEVVFPEKLVFSMVLTNEQGKEVVSAEAGKPEDWRQEILTTVIFNAVGRQTKVSLYQTVVEEEARKTGAYQSWINMFERLNKIIAG